MVENQFGRKLKCLRTDNGGEFKSEEFVKFCRERGIRREFITPYSPEQNGIAKRMNQTIKERVVSMLQHSGLSDGFWAEALGLQIPQELWIGSKANYDKLRIFGYEAYALIWKEDCRKLEPRSRKCVFLGYGANDEIGYQSSWTPSTDKSSEVRT